MADIELVIKIPEYFYKHCKSQEDATEIQLAVKNGILLPKGHGDLIDEKELRQKITTHKYSNNFCKEHNIDQSINVSMVYILMADAPVIIEADKENNYEL